MAMNDLQAALVLGAMAQDAIKPQRVKDLHTFFAQHPDAITDVASILGHGVRIQQPFSSMLSMMGGMLETANNGLDQGPEPDLFGLGATVQGKPASAMAQGGLELG